MQLYWSLKGIHMLQLKAQICSKNDVDRRRAGGSVYTALGVHIWRCVQTQSYATQTLAILWGHTDMDTVYSIKGVQLLMDTEHWTWSEVLPLTCCKVVKNAAHKFSERLQIARFVQLAVPKPNMFNLQCIHVKESSKSSHFTGWSQLMFGISA